MDSLLRSLELQNEAKTQELAIAYEKIANFEKQVADLTGPDTSYVTPEDQVAFIQKIADSSSKFSKEAQDILDAIQS